MIYDANGKKINIGNTFYTAADDVNLKDSASEVYALYDALRLANPSYVTRNTLTHGGLTLYEYVFADPDYNSQGGQRSEDAEIDKPVILLISGVHGYEKSSVMGLYSLCRSLCECEFSINDLRESFCIKVIPLVCPYGFDADSRLNENSVNINRNFDSSNWTRTAAGSNYSGATPGSENETQIVQDWIDANTDAVMFIDWHNSSYTSEISCVLALDTSETMQKIKMKYLLGVNKVIPYWNANRGISNSNIYAYTGESTSTGSSISYANDKGINAVTLETSWNVISSGQHSAFTIATGSEAMMNMLLGLKNMMEPFYI